MSSAAARTDVTDIAINCKRPVTIVTNTPADTTASTRPNPLSRRGAVKPTSDGTLGESATTAPNVVTAS